MKIRLAKQYIFKNSAYLYVKLCFSLKRRQSFNLNNFYFWCEHITNYTANLSLKLRTRVKNMENVDSVLTLNISGLFNILCE